MSTSVDGILDEIKTHEPLTPQETMVYAAELLQLAKKYLNNLIEGEDGSHVLLRTLELVGMLSHSNVPNHEFEIGHQGDSYPEETEVSEETTIDSDLILDEDISSIEEQVEPIRFTGKFVAVRQSDLDSQLTEHGRKLNDVLKSFSDLDEAAEFGRYATERPLYIGELVEQGEDKFLVLKYSFMPEVQ